MGNGHAACGPEFFLLVPRLNLICANLTTSSPFLQRGDRGDLDLTY